jgi:hypothetical protein
MEAYRFEFCEKQEVISTFAMALDGDLEALDMATRMAKEFDIRVRCGDRSVVYVKKGGAPSNVLDRQAG